MSKYKVRWTERRDIRYKTVIEADNEEAAFYAIYLDIDNVKSSVNKVQEDCLVNVSVLDVKEEVQHQKIFTT